MKIWVEIVIEWKEKKINSILQRKSGKWVEGLGGEQETFGKRYLVFFLLNCIHWQRACLSSAQWVCSFMNCFLCKGQLSSTQQSVDTTESSDHQPGDVPEKCWRRRFKSSKSMRWLRKCTQCAAQTAQWSIYLSQRSLMLCHSCKGKKKTIYWHMNMKV